MRDTERETDWEPDTGEGRVRAASYLTILNDEVSPEELARLAGMQPDEAWSKGDAARRGRETQPFNAITFVSHLADLATPTDHFAALIERLRPFAARIAAIADLPSTHSARIWIVEHTERDMVDAFTEPGQIEVVAAMHAEVVFSSYFYDDSYDDEEG